jgi:hypothetical protein
MGLTCGSAASATETDWQTGPAEQRHSGSCLVGLARLLLLRWAKAQNREGARGLEEQASWARCAREGEERESTWAGPPAIAGPKTKRE